MLAVGQKVGPAMRRMLPCFELGQSQRLSACSVDLPQGFPIVRLVDDDVVLAPSSSSWIGRLGENGDRTACSRNFLQVAVGEEANEFSVGRPKGKNSALGALQFPGSKVAERLHPDRIPLSLAPGTERH